MENKNTVSIPLVDILSEMLNERVVMSGEDYVIFSNLKKIEKTKIDEANVILAEKIAGQELQIKINEAKEYLNKTDHKLYNGYKPKEGEDLVKIERLRDEAREFIRANEGDE
jgi:CRISPR/Cas system CMR-associated protein Cmr3 (group 5 of RAMP superfamily)